MSSVQGAITGHKRNKNVMEFVIQITNQSGLSCYLIKLMLTTA